MDGNGPRYTKVKVINKGSGGAIYCLGFLGAVVYYIQHAATFWAGVLGILKALVWPAFLVYGLLKSVGA
jgi:hypothetical protein